MGGQCDNCLFGPCDTECIDEYGFVKCIGYVSKNVVWLIMEEVDDGKRV